MRFPALSLSLFLVVAVVAILRLMRGRTRIELRRHCFQLMALAMRQGLPLHSLLQRTAPGLRRFQRRRMAELARELESGECLSEAMSLACKETFSRRTRSLVAAAEGADQLASVCAAEVGVAERELGARHFWFLVAVYAGLLISGICLIQIWLGWAMPGIAGVGLSEPRALAGWMTVDRGAGFGLEEIPPPVTQPWLQLPALLQALSLPPAELALALLAIPFLFLLHHSLPPVRRWFSELRRRLPQWTRSQRLSSQERALATWHAASARGMDLESALGLAAASVDHPGLARRFAAAVRAHQEAEGAEAVVGVLPLPATTRAAIGWAMQAGPTVLSGMLQTQLALAQDRRSAHQQRMRQLIPAALVLLLGFMVYENFLFIAAFMRRVMFISGSGLW